MAQDERYIATKALELNFVDNITGNPLSGGYAEFYIDNDRATGKVVYEKTGSPPNYTYTALGNPVYMNGSGKFVRNQGSTTPIVVYAYPYDEAGDIQNYYVKIFNSDGSLQEDIEGWPYLTPSEDPTKIENSISNEISNPQFVDVLFEPENGSVISISGAVSNQSYTIAPDWDIVVSTNGSASVTINRTAIAGSDNVPTNPPFKLDILSSGANISQLRLRQRLNNNPDIWANGYVSGHFVISSEDLTDHTIKMLYSPSVAPSPTTILTSTTGTSGYQQASNTVQLDAGTNTDDGDDGYVDILIELPVTGHYSITSIQVVGLNTDEQDVHYDQETANRQIDHLFNYYNPWLQYKPVDSYLTAWRFAYNPAQQGGTSISMGSIGANKSKYLWDQTIGFQSVDNSFGINKNANGALQLTTTATTQPALIQYITQDKIKDIMYGYSSIYIKTRRGGATANTVCTVSLWYTKDASLPDISSGTNNSLVLTLDANGKPATFNGNWTEITRPGLGEAQFTINSSSDFNHVEKYFNGYYVGNVSESQVTNYGAIVVGFESIASGGIIDLYDISIVPGKLAAPTSIKSYEQVLQECQYFYEKSYLTTVSPGTVTTDSQILFSYNARNTNNSLLAMSFEINFKDIKRTAPVMSLYSPDTGASDYLRIGMYSGSNTATRSGGAISTNPGDLQISTNYTENSSVRNVFYLPSNTTVQLTASSSYNEVRVTMHYVADSRLGIV